MVKCPMCNKWNKDYDSERIKCWNCEYKIETDDPYLERDDNK